MSERPICDVDLDTPALLLDLDVLEGNIARMAEFARQAGVSLRPHAKTHKSPLIARKQLQAGAIGITCQKLGEAEVLVDAGIEGLLITNEIIGETKIRRLIELARRAPLLITVDHAENVADLSGAAVSGEVGLEVLVEVDVGMHRCGVQPGRPALDLARIVASAPGLRFRGLMGYEGHVVGVPDRPTRTEMASACLKLLVDTAGLLRANGLQVDIVSSSGTGTFDIGGGFPGVTEIQVGSYATMDGHYQEVGVPFDPALTLLAAVVSAPAPGLAILDAGLKALSTDQGLPKPIGIPGAEVKYLAEEHAWLFLPDGVVLRPGDKVRLLPAHGCTTINLHDRYYACRGGFFVETWPVAARGKSQ